MLIFGLRQPLDFKQLDIVVHVERMIKSNEWAVYIFALPTVLYAVIDSSLGCHLQSFFAQETHFAYEACMHASLSADIGAVHAKIKDMHGQRWCKVSAKIWKCKSSKKYIKVV